MYHKNNKNKKENINDEKELYNILINYSPIRLTDDSIEITGLSFNLNKNYELIVNDNNNLEIIKKKDINKNNSIDKLFINFIEDNDNKYKEFINNNFNINNNDVFEKLNQDMPLIKDNFENNIDYGVQSLYCDFYQIKCNSILKINDLKEKIVIYVSKEIDNEKMNEIILNGIYIFVENSHQLNIRIINT